MSGPEVAVQAVGRAGGIAPRKRLVVVSGSSHPALAQKIADHLGVDLGARELKTFADGETYCRYDDSVPGRTCSSCKRRPSRSRITSSSC